MAKARLLAFLLCDHAAKGPDGKVNLQGLFDTIIAPRNRGEVKQFFLYYRVVVEEPCAIVLRVFDPESQELSNGMRRDSFAVLGPVQTVWGLSSDTFCRPGIYVLELQQEAEGSKASSLAQMRLTVKESEE